jgi:hypothetical protein
MGKSGERFEIWRRKRRGEKRRGQKKKGLKRGPRKDR